MEKFYATLIVAIYGIKVTIDLVRRKPYAYRNSLFFLVLSLLLSSVHMYASQRLRGASAPTNIRVYFTILTLIIFLIFRIPGIWKKIDFIRENNNHNGSLGIAVILVGIFTLTVQIWAAPSHTFNGGINFAETWHVPMTVIGLSLVILGGYLIGRSKGNMRKVDEFSWKHGRLLKGG